QHCFIVHVVLDDIDGQKQDQMLRSLASPRWNNDPPPGGDQPRHEMSADKTAAAEDQRCAFAEGAHGASFARSAERSTATSLNAPLPPLGGTTPRRSRSATYGSPSCA